MSVPHGGHSLRQPPAALPVAGKGYLSPRSVHRLVLHTRSPWCAPRLGAAHGAESKQGSCQEHAGGCKTHFGLSERDYMRVLYLYNSATDLEREADGVSCDASFLHHGPLFPGGGRAMRQHGESKEHVLILRHGLSVSVQVRVALPPQLPGSCRQPGRSSCVRVTRYSKVLDSILPLGGLCWYHSAWWQGEVRMPHVPDPHSVVQQLARPVRTAACCSGKSPQGCACQRCGHWGKGEGALTAVTALHVAYWDMGDCYHIVNAGNGGMKGNGWAGNRSGDAQGEGCSLKSMYWGAHEPQPEGAGEHAAQGAAAAG